MSHGAKCGCAMCSVGKKMGMIKEENHEEHEDHRESMDRNMDAGMDMNEGAKTCPACQMPLAENGTCKRCSV